MASCQGCAMLVANGGGANGTPACYAHGGTPNMGMAAIRKRAGRVGDEAYTLQAAIEGASFKAKAARMGSIGCPCATGTTKQDVATIQACGLAPLAYCHHTGSGELGEDLRGFVCASVDDLPQAKDRLAAGWSRVTMPVAKDVTPLGLELIRQEAGATTVLCPADAGKREDGRPGRVTCNDCRLCDGTAPGQVLVLFLEKNTTQLKGGSL